MGEMFRPIGRGEREKLKSPAQSTRILGPALPIDPDTRLRLGRSTINTLHGIDDRNLFTYYLIERNLPVISNRTESNGGGRWRITKRECERSLSSDFQFEK